MELNCKAAESLGGGAGRARIIYLPNPKPYAYPNARPVPLV